MFPSAPPALAGLEIGGACFPSAATGGDVFDYIPTPNGCMGIVCGDVSGHGIGPALLMVLVRSYLRALARTHVDPAEILTTANRLVHDDMEDDRFITLFFARLDPSTRALVYAGAGHEAHLIDASGRVTTLPSTGLPLGILEEAEIGQGPPIILEREQMLLLLSDGILETKSAGGEQFGLDRVLETVKVHRQKPVQEIAEAIYQAARDYAGNVAQDDDMTIVIVRVR
jgi:phosphoserine phosphatase RsbU/P